MEKIYTCPKCGQKTLYENLRPYYGSGFVPADRAHQCPYCHQILPLNQFKELK